eukprot:6144146-Pyramimonas_sp.AAC.1
MRHAQSGRGRVKPCLPLISHPSTSSTFEHVAPSCVGEASGSQRFVHLAHHSRICRATGAPGKKTVYIDCKACWGGRRRGPSIMKE